jgi:cytochrome P450
MTEHEQAINVDKNRHEDFIDILLAINHENEQNLVIDRTNVKAILLDMIVAANDTSATSIEWILSELLRHPRVMKILQEEIQNEVGNKRMVEEKDLKKFNYLDMVIDETLRLHPVGPLLLPRECRESITIDGYFIKENTRVIVNAWAIGRDPNIWSENAEEFYPKRFHYNIFDFRQRILGNG